MSIEVHGINSIVVV